MRTLIAAIGLAMLASSTAEAAQQKFSPVVSKKKTDRRRGNGKHGARRQLVTRETPSRPLHERVTRSYDKRLATQVVQQVLPSFKTKRQQPVFVLAKQSQGTDRRTGYLFLPKTREGVRVTFEDAPYGVPAKIRISAPFKVTEQRINKLSTELHFDVSKKTGQATTLKFR